MALRETAQYEFAPKFARVIVNNPDGSYPSTAGVLSGVGPFDFSGVDSIAAVPIIIKIDNGAEVVESLDLTAAADDAAVTPAEFIAAYNLATVGPGPVSGTTASVVSGRVKIVKTTIGSSKYLQVTGEGAQLAGFGYGYGAKIVKIDTQQSIADAPTMKESERLAITDSNGLDTAIISDGYRTGTVLTLTDTARDMELRSVIEGGTWDPVTKVYAVPTSSSVKPTFTIETFTSMYSKDDNLEANLEGYIQRVSKSCKGTAGERAGDRNLQVATYTLNVTPYRDPATNVRYPDTEETNLTIDAYELLDVKNV